MVRAMASSEDDLNLFKNNGIVAVGWSKVDFTKYKHDSGLLWEKIRKEYYENGKFAPQMIGRWMNQVYRFVSIKKGDYIVVPYRSQILLAEATEEFRYDLDACGQDLSNQLLVNYKKNGEEFVTFPRAMLSEGLQRRLRVMGSTISDLEDFKKEIINLFEKKQSYTDTISTKFDEESDYFKQKLGKVLTDGSSNLKTGGVGLENLVCELMKCEGYDARVLAKTKSKTKFGDNADADVEAWIDDRFISQKIFIQVKHHSDYSDSWGIEQLEKIMETKQYPDYTYVFVTSAKVSNENFKRAEKSDIKVIDGGDLVAWIVENINKLKPETLKALRISKAPHIVDIQ